MSDIRDDFLSFIETATFRRFWNDYDLTDEHFFDLQNEVVADPKSGDVVKGTGGVRKLRFSPKGSGKGKSGSLRVMYHYYEEFGIVLLLTLFAKNVMENISENDKKAIKAAVEMQYKLLSEKNKR